MGKDLKGRELGKGLSQRKDGRYSARFVRKNGKRIEKYFLKLPEAKKWLTDTRYEDEYCTIGSSSQMTVDTWFTYWSDNIESSIARYSTVKVHKSRYRNHIKDVIGYMSLADVKPMHCQNVLNILKNKNYSYGTIKMVRITMHVLFEAAVENDLLIYNPVRKNVYVKKETQTGNKKERRVLSLEEQRHFLDVAKGTRDYYQYILFLQTGLRLGELVGLQWKDVDFKNRIISVNRSMQWTPEKKCFVISLPKSSNGVRKIPMTQDAYDALKAVEQKRKKSKVMCMEYAEFVFLNKKGVPTKNVTYNGKLYRLAQKAGVDRLSPHVFRHTFATRCIEAGMRPKTLQKILGHSSIHITMNLYVHVLEEEKTKEMEKFEAYLNESKAKMA